MTCAQCTNSGKKHEKTLYDKTVEGRLAHASRRTKRVVASGIVVGLFATMSAASLAPAHAADFSGFSTFASATPLRIEVHEPAIPVPADPQLELNFSYTKVNGASGPTGTARASAMWPGDAIGEGLKTFGEQLGLPDALTGGGYPVQINAASPGDTGSATQEFFPGMVGKVATSDKSSVAKAGYGTVGDVVPGDDGSGTGAKAPANPLEALQKGDLTGLLGLLAPSATGPSGGSPSAGLLGPLSLLIGASGMDSISSTTYDSTANTVIATATSRLGSVKLLGGIVKLDGVEVVTTVTSNIAAGAKVSRKVTIGAMSIAGNKFGLTGDGVEAMGKTTPIPGLPDAPAAALKALGISFELGKAVTTKTGPAGSVTAEGLRITIATKPLLSKLPKLPLADLVSKLPDLPGQAAILKGLIVALGQATPQVDVVLGVSAASAQTVAGIDPGGPTTNPTTPVDPSGPTTNPSGPIDSGPGVGPSTGEQPPGAIADPGNVSATPGLNLAANIPGLPPLKGLPTWLALLGLAIAGGAGWYIRRAGLVLFGGASTCTHGLKAGIPDLRKA